MPVCMYMYCDICQIYMYICDIYVPMCICMYIICTYNEYYSATRKRKSCHFATTWMDFEGIPLSQRKTHAV